MSDTRHSALEPSANAAQQLLTHTIHSDLKAAELLIKQQPDLLLVEESIGEHQHVTALQLAFDLRDYGMHEMHRKHAPDQTKVKCSEHARQKPLVPDKYFNLAAEAISKASNEAVDQELRRHSTSPDTYLPTELGRVLDTYREACDKHGETTPRDVANVYDAFHYYYHAFDTWDKAKLFFIQVIGYVERLEPVWFKQALVQGTKKLLKPDVELQRVSECRVKDDVHSLVNLKPNAGWGFDFACDDLGVVTTREPTGKRFLFWRRGGHLGSFLGDFPCSIKKYCDAIESKFKALECANSQDGRHKIHRKP